MWWSVPPGVTTFTTWREKTTVYHEGVPGHHLQIGQAVYQRATLNSWRRLACWVSGHGEGWALYAERLMADLGFLDDPGDRLGMLDGQRMRAAPLRRAGQAKVHPDVPHDAGGPHPLSVEHAEPVTGVVQEAQVGHQALGVQGPALAVAAHPAGQPAPAVQG